MKLLKLHKKLANKPSLKSIKTNCKEIINTLAFKIGERNIENFKNLDDSKNYLNKLILKYGIKTKEQFITIKNKKTANISFEIKSKTNPKKIIVIGAHYDTVEGSNGANDNASGIAGLIETYRLLRNYNFKYTIRFVAFTLEEPPYFGSKKMGSMVYAKKCFQDKDKIKLMISFDMIGYSNKFKKQRYPFTYMKETYPKKANFLCVASLPSSAKYAYLWKQTYNKYSASKIYEIIAPASIKGIHESDHYSFSKHGFPAILISDTGYYRNNFYHTNKDMPAKINYNFLANNIMSIFHTIKEIASLDKLL